MMLTLFLGVLGGFILGIIMAIVGVAELERYMKEMKDEENLLVNVVFVVEQNIVSEDTVNY